uniref:hypothetical protein n=1 Tax=Ruminococcus bromii TaxID=40518 RepID=UPI003FD7BA30
NADRYCVLADNQIFIVFLNIKTLIIIFNIFQYLFDNTKNFLHNILKIHQPVRLDLLILCIL